MTTTEELNIELLSKQATIEILNDMNDELIAERDRILVELDQARLDARTSMANEVQAMLHLADIRKAAGDNGKLMLPELIEHIRGLRSQVGENERELKRFRLACARMFGELARIGRDYPALADRCERARRGEGKSNG